MPPEVLTGALLDRVGADDGACSGPEPPVLDELEPVFDELEPLLADPEPLPAVPERLAPGEPALDGRADDEPWADGLVLAGAAGTARAEVFVAAWEAPGSMIAIAPAAAALATPAAAVTVLSAFRPRSRSATARDTAREAAL